MEDCSRSRNQRQGHRHQIVIIIVIMTVMTATDIEIRPCSWTDGDVFPLHGAHPMHLDVCPHLMVLLVCS